MRFHILLFHNTYLSVFYDVPKEQKKIAHSLWAYFRFRIAYKLLAIYRAFTIKKIHLLHVLQVLSREALGFGNSRLQILTEIMVKSTAINILGITSHDVTTKRPIEAQHLAVHLGSSLNLTAAISLF